MAVLAAIVLVAPPVMAAGGSGVQAAWVSAWQTWGNEREAVAVLAGSSFASLLKGAGVATGSGSCADLTVADAVSPGIATFPAVAVALAACGVTPQATAAPSCGHLLAAVQLDAALVGVIEAASAPCRAPSRTEAQTMIPQPPNGGAAFTDMGGYGWAATAVARLAALGVIQGESRDKFDPAGTLTRAEWAVLFGRLMQLPPGPQPLRYLDVSATSWYFDGVQEAGWYIPQAVGGAFDPQAAATRIDVAATLGAFLIGLGHTAPSSAQASAVWARFSDGTSVPPDLAVPASLVVELGLMQGFPDGSFGVTAPVTRAQVAVLLWRLDGQASAN